MFCAPQWALRGSGDFLTARVVVDDDPVKTDRAVGVALAPFPHQRARRAWSSAGAVAADRILSIAVTVLISRADDARVEFGELATTVDTASAPPAGVEHRAVTVKLACRGATRALATFRTGKAFDDRRDASAVTAHIRDAGIVMLAAAVAMVRAWGRAAALGADLVLCATARADVLGGNASPRSPEGFDRNGRYCCSEESPAIRGCGELPGDEIEPVLIHRHP
jgi:hypothetical protein